MNLYKLMLSQKLLKLNLDLLKLKLNKLMLSLKLNKFMVNLDFQDRRNLASLSCVFWSDYVSSAGFIGFLGSS